MKRRVRIGLIVGAIAFPITIIVAAFLGVCAPFVALIGGAAVGFLASQSDEPPSRREGLRFGVTGGLIVGAVMLAAQIIGTLGALIVFQVSGLTPLAGSIPPPSAEPSVQLVYYLSGIGTGACIGLLDIVAAAGGGAAGGYLGAGIEEADPVAAGRSPGPG